MTRPTKFPYAVRTATRRAAASLAGVAAVSVAAFLVAMIGSRLAGAAETAAFPNRPIRIVLAF